MQLGKLQKCPGDRSASATEMAGNEKQKVGWCLHFEAGKGGLAFNIVSGELMRSFRGAAPRPGKMKLKADSEDFPVNNEFTEYLIALTIFAIVDAQSAIVQLGRSRGLRQRPVKYRSGGSWVTQAHMPDLREIGQGAFQLAN